jgi:parallel beta-helix repeat protein
MISGAVVNALDFNADPTGATSSSTAIQNAIASLVTSGGTVFLPAGTYNIATVISVTASNISLVGEPGTVVEITGAAIHNAFEFTACTNIVVSDLRFEWNGASLNTNNPGWENNYALSFKPNPSTFASCNNVTIENCYFNECASMVTWRIDAAQEVAIAADADKRYYNFKFVNNTVACTLNSGPYAALDATYLDRYQISGNLFQSNSVGYSGIRQTGAGAVGGGNQYSSKGLITNNRIISSRWGIYVGAANNILIADNVLDGQENESIDFEGCSDCTANANRLNNVKYAFALFYYYKNIKISNNHVSLVDTADYFLNHSPVGVTTGYGDLVVSDNWAQCSGGSVYFQLQNGHHINIKNNEFRNVVYTATSNFYSLEMSNNTWTWDRTNPSAAAWLILPADLNTSYQSGYIRITNNEFIATTPLSINCILLFANQTFANEFYIMNNLFMNVAYPVSYDSAAPNRANNRTLFFDNVIEGETSPFAIGAGNPTAEFIFKGLVNRSGLSVFDNPTDFVNTVGTGGCGLGSTFNRNPPASGQVWGWVNTSNTGTPTWTAIATLP